MCGIAGAWLRKSPSESKLVSLAERMLDAVAHRGPDDGGYAVGARFFLGNRRLSIFDLSPAGNQPFFSEDGHIWLVLNGEIYNHYEIRRELEADFDFRSSTDTEVLLRAYQKWGMACLSRFIGMFAFALWDGRTGQMVLCRDRIGIKPLYYADSGSALYFASEIKALLAAGIEPRLDRGVMKDYLATGLYDHTDRTFFDGIRQVKQGHYVTVTDGVTRETCYWNLAERLALAPAASDDAQEAYWATLDDSVRLRMRADVPCAVMLSGGLDSSAIAVLAGPHARRPPLNVMTFRHHEARYDEGPWADLVTQGRNWVSQSVFVTEEHVATEFDRLLWHQEEPFGGVANFADSLLAAKARANGVYVLLEGQGADETLAGYEYYYLHHLADLAETDDAAARLLYRQYAAQRAGTADTSANGYADFMCRARSRAGNLAQDGTAATRTEALAAGFRDEAGTGFQERQVSRSSLVNALFRDLTATKVPRVLRFKDKSSMMHGVELRVPFLDHRLIETAFAIPPARKLVDGYTKHCLREQMRTRLPQETCFHVKRQVQTPQREWLRGGLRPLVEETIHSESFAARGLFDVAAVERLYRDYDERPDRYPNSFFIWQWLSVERWARLFLDGQGTASWQRKPTIGNTRRYPPAGGAKEL